MWLSADRSIALIVLALAGGAAGCRSLQPCALHTELPAGPISWESSLQAACGELARGHDLEAAGDERCVDAYFRAAHLSWQAIAEAGACGCYGEATGCLLLAAQRFGRLDPECGLVIHEGGRSDFVPVVHQGFAWGASDFQRLHPPPRGHEPLLSRRYGCQGWGVPLVVERRRNGGDPLEARFFPEKAFFGATAVLRFDEMTTILEFHNPLAARCLETDAGPLPLAADLTAPLAQTLEEAPRTYFAGFVEPGRAAATSRLSFLEPYQPGKVPLVLIHGLFSDPLSWADLVNDLRATPGFTDRYQLWVFRYPTGQGFLQSAAALRVELAAAAQELDPGCSDQALHQMVLIGHSMGGLIAKLQVTYSDELIWNRLANRPLEEIITTESTRARLAEICYFDPSPDVARVVFIASPHAGSLRSSELIGRGVSHLVEPSPQQAAMHEQLMRDNPDTFNPQVERRFPTSIDMLAPQSPLLAAMQKMRLREGIKLHNIMGVSCPLSLDGPSDGVVSARSASHPCCQSVLAVGASHVKVHRSIQTGAEILRILDYQASAGPISRRETAPATAPREF
ncbi:MAG TPA: alpha/beta fold hydrolase [Pirellulaceae bacterium]|nr:alpha/beta fold hydrolase [Pirellulaceae bacterium]